MRLDMDSKQDRILVVDNSAVVASNLKSNDQLEYVVSQNNDIEALKADFNNLNVDAIVAISPLDSANNVSVVAYSVKQLNADLSSDISGDIKNVIDLPYGDDRVDASIRWQEGRRAGFWQDIW